MPQSEWNLPLAGHLLRRTTFGFTSSQLQQALNDGPAKTIDRLLARSSDYADFETGMAALAPLEPSSQDSGELWLYRMQNSPWPLLEKATLFWFNFFGVSGARVPETSLMEQHLALLRKHALGRFDQMLAAVARDPAVIMANGAPPLVDRDAFSGVTVLRRECHFDPAKHRGNLMPDDAVRHALSQPATAQTVVSRVCRWLAGNVIVPQPIGARWAEAFSRDYDIAALLSSVLHSDFFLSRQCYRQDVKSPVEFALNLAIALNVSMPPAQLQGQLSALGQRIPDPPSRDGWPGGRRWLTDYTLVIRSRVAAGIVRAGHFPDRQALIATLLQNDAPSAILHSLEPLDGSELAQAIANLPEFQLA
jgi:uncharacterized protein (DUF1800 family)